MNSLSNLIGKRLRIAREGCSRTQDELASALGLKDRQSVSAIEIGERKITPEELIKAADFLDKPIGFFTDPYVVAEQNAFSYRAATLDSKVLKDFADYAQRLISAQRRFRDLLGETTCPVHSQLREISKSTPLNVASLSGERTAVGWNLGSVPAKNLREVAEEKLGISILFVDADPRISGAACWLDDGDVILINRREPEGRRNFNIGHEIFHLLTWEALPPDELDYDPENASQKKPRCEQLADCYARGLLMPVEAVKQRWSEREQQGLDAWLTQHSSELLVSRSALYWRLVNLGLISKDEHPMPAGGKNGGDGGPTEVPRLYNETFVKSLHRALDRGLLSGLRAAEVLDCPLDELVEVFESYNLEVPFGY